MEVVVKALVLSLAFVPAVALACPYEDSPGCPMKPTAAAAHADAKVAGDPASCAHNADLVGGNCSYTTSQMAKRVLDEGTPWSFTGSLTHADNQLASHVAAPYSVGPQPVHVVGNEVLEQLVDAGGTQGRVTLRGRMLEVDGLKYFVLTSYSALDS